MSEKYRLVTRSDFDGLVCAVLLKELDIDDNTLIIFASDNGGLSTLHRKGYPTSNEPLRAGKGWCYEGGIRVPAIIRLPSSNRTMLLR